MNDGIKKILDQSGLNIPIYLGFMPPKESPIVVSLHLTGGSDPNLFFYSTKENIIYHPSMQVICKATDYSDGINTLKAISNILSNTKDIIVGNIRYISIHQQSDILELGYVDGKYKFSLNFRTSIMDVL